MRNVIMPYNNFKVQFLKFFSVGTLTTTISIGFYYVAFSILDLPLYSSYIAIYIMMISLSYVLNAKITFKQDRNKKTLIKYFLTYLFGMLIGLCFLRVMEMITPLSNFVLSIMIIIPRTVIVFIFTKYVVFTD